MKFVGYGLVLGVLLAGLLRPFGPLSALVLVVAPFFAWRFGTDERPPRFSGQRLEFLDAARGVAAMTVTIDHVIEVHGASVFRILNAPAYWGNVGVLLFFAISGFIIPATLERKGSPWAFPINRAFRILPLFSIAFAVAALIRLASPAIPDAGLLEHPVRTILLNLSLTHFFAHQGGVLTLSWTLCVEAFFYLVAWTLHRAGLLVRTNAIVVGASALLLVQGVRTLLGTDGGAYLFGWTLIFLMGTLTYRYATGATTGRRAGLELGLGTVSLFIVFGFMRPQRLPLADSGASSVLIAAALFGAFFALRGRTWPPVLTWLGRVSYGVYLWHGVLILATPVSLPLIPSLILIVGGALGLAALTQRFVEEPMVAYGRRLVARLPEPRDPVVS